MIDDSDSDFALLAGMGTGGWLSLVFLVLAIVLGVVAYTNSEDCEKSHCPHGAPKLLDHECVCVEAPGK